MLDSWRVRAPSAISGPRAGPDDIQLQWSPNASRIAPSSAAQARSARRLGCRSGLLRASSCWIVQQSVPIRRIRAAEELRWDDYYVYASDPVSTKPLVEPRRG